MPKPQAGEYGVSRNEVNEDDKHDGDSAQVHNDMLSTPAEGPMEDEGDERNFNNDVYMEKVADLT